MSARSTFVLAVLAALAISVVPVIAADGQGTPELGSYVTTHRFHSARGASASVGALLFPRNNPIPVYLNFLVKSCER